MPRKVSRRSFVKQSTVLGASSLLGADFLSRNNPYPLPVAGEGMPSAYRRQERNIVSVATGSDYIANTAGAVGRLGGMERFVSEGSSVAILANPQRPNPGAFTRPDIVSSIIQMCKNAGAKEINCISLQKESAWVNTGLKKVVDEEGVNLVLVGRQEEAKFVLKKIPSGVSLKETRIMKALYDNDVFINIPVTKDHAGNKFTGTLKNLMGINFGPDNRSFHKPGWKTDINAIRHLEQCIADLNSIVKSHLCIVDATEFIITNGPFGPGKLHKPQKVIAGTDRVAIDAYCCTLWGLKGEDIIAIRQAHQHKLGEINLTKVKIKEISI